MPQQYKGLNFSVPEKNIEKIDTIPLSERKIVIYEKSFIYPLEINKINEIHKKKSQKKKHTMTTYFNTANIIPKKWISLYYREEFETILQNLRMTP